MKINSTLHAAIHKNTDSSPAHSHCTASTSAPAKKHGHQGGLRGKGTAHLSTPILLVPRTGGGRSDDAGSIVLYVALTSGLTVMSCYFSVAVLCIVAILSL